jgi:putative hydrolases of HD superfamily
VFYKMNERFEKQIKFLIEIDKVKQIFRQTRLYDHSRYENDAEHGWHMCLMALILAEYANKPNIDISKVVKMALIHDIVEIDAGDTFLFSNEQQNKREKEVTAAKKIFGILPSDQRDEFINLWEEFEEMQTPEAKFASSLDRLGPVMQNYYDDGHAWRNHQVSPERVLSVNSQIKNGSDTIWEYAKSLVDSVFEKEIPKVD